MGVCRMYVGWAEFPESFWDRYEEEIGCAGPGVEIQVEYGYSPEVLGLHLGRPDRQYPAEAEELDVDNVSFRVRNECMRPFDDKFLEVAQQFASDWFDENSATLEQSIRSQARREAREEEASVKEEAAYIAQLQDTDGWA